MDESKGLEQARKPASGVHDRASKSKLTAALPAGAPQQAHPALQADYP